MKATRKWIDPFDEMSDDEFDAHIDRLFATRPRTVAVSLRVAPDLLQRVRRQAKRAGVPYQTFVKSILEAAVSRLEARRPR
jgi:predicted DNA binding CopG/RHH family protein